MVSRACGLTTAGLGTPFQTCMEGGERERVVSLSRRGVSAASTFLWGNAGGLLLARCFLFEHVVRSVHPG